METKQDERTTTQHWLPLESNPSVLTDYIHKIGVPYTWAFRDCYGLTDQTQQFVPQPCFALLFLFPVTQLKGERQAEEERIEKEGQHVCEKVYFIKQHVKNACGTIAVIHAIANNKESLNIDSGTIHEFLTQTLQNTPSERGHLLGEHVGMTQHHKEYSKKGVTRPKDFAKSDFHFICFTAVDGHLYELDGSKKFPINHGPTTQERMLQDAAKVIQTNFINKTPGEKYFSLITLGPAQGDEIIPEELQKPPELTNDQVHPEKVEEIILMGFTKDQAIQGLKKRNNNVTQAIEYILSHTQFSDSYSTSTPARHVGVVVDPFTSSFTQANEDFVNHIMAMGFHREAAVAALVLENNNLENAINSLLQ